MQQNLLLNSNQKWRIKMKIISLITMLLLSIASVQMAQADNLTTYNISVTFSDTTEFSGNLTYDSTANQVTSLTGTLYDKAMGDIVVGLTHLLTTESDGKGGILATVYAQNSTTVFASGSNSKTAGNENAFVTIDFNPTNPKAADINLFAYADCTPGGLMMNGTVCTTGMAGGGTMGGIPTNQTITMPYNVTAVFNEPMLQPVNTTFTGSFTFDFVLSKITNLHGTMNQAMMDATPTVNFSYQVLPSASDGSGGILASVFKNNSTDVFQGGGYATGGTLTSGNNNAYVTVDINPLDPTNVLSSNLSNIVYADCSPGGLMGGTKCMTGHAAGGTMKATPLSLTIKTAPSPGIFLNDTSVTISLGPNAELGQNADWWLVAYSPWGQWYSYVYPNKWVDIGTDLSHVTPAYQGPLANISSLELFDITGLAGGTYDLYFGVDMNKNGVLDYGQLYHSSFTLNIP
jgi:hypothetical protein